MKQPIEEIEHLLVKAWSAAVALGDARYIAEASLHAALSKDSRMDPVRESLADLRSALSQKAEYSIAFDSGACRVCDFGGTTPFPFLRVLHEDLKVRSRNFGVAQTAIRNTAGVHQLSTWVEPLVRGGEHVAFFLWNGGSYTVAPFGSKEPFFGTNPLAYAIPTDEGPLVCDMATSEIPFLSLMTAIRSGNDLEKPSGVNNEGKITNVAREIYDIENDSPVRLLPMGLGYKGSALMLLIEILTGALIGAKMGREATESTFKPEEFGGWLCVWNIASFTQPMSFRERVGDLARGIRNSQPMDNVSEISLPGDRSSARMAKHKQQGNIEIADETYGELLALANAGSK